uniref:Uncharacterized protein n=1 Tax=Arundo donax TaxID=35708 RepID=A0A0A8Y908_ARUDO
MLASCRTRSLEVKKTRYCSLWY